MTYHGTACDAASVHVGPTIRRTGILIFNLHSMDSTWLDKRYGYSRGTARRSESIEDLVEARVYDCFLYHLQQTLSVDSDVSDPKLAKAL